MRRSAVLHLLLLLLLAALPVLAPSPAPAQAHPPQPGSGTVRRPRRRVPDALDPSLAWLVDDKRRQDRAVRLRRVGTELLGAGRAQEAAVQLWKAMGVLGPSGTDELGVRRLLALSLGDCARVLCSERQVVSPCLEGTVLASPAQDVKPLLVHVASPTNDGPVQWTRLAAPAPTALHGQWLLELAVGGQVLQDLEGAWCWFYPGEHLSFSLLDVTSQRSAPPLQWPDPPLTVQVDTEVGGAGPTAWTLPGSEHAPVVGSVLQVLGTGNFFHLVKEGISSLLLLHSVLPPAVPVLVPDTPRWRQWQALLPDVANSSRLKFVPASVQRVTAPAAVVIDWRKQPGRFDAEPPFSTAHLAAQSAWAFDLVRRAVADVPEPHGPHRPRLVLYVSRDDARVRCVHGEDVLVSELERATHAEADLAVERALLTDLDLGRTADLFRRARIVIGPHGSGLFNAALFSPPGTTVLAFSLWPEHESKEENLVAVCAAASLDLVRVGSVRAAFHGNYSVDHNTAKEVVELARKKLAAN